MRVIAGTYRSRRLVTPAGAATRPTSDRLRETLFNVLAPHLEDCVFLDLYAGSGAVAIEALSRGARMVYFVESGRLALAAIRKNLAALGITEGFQVIEKDAQAALRRLDSEAVRCDVCFLDPPYDAEDEYADTLGFLSQSRLISPESVVIAEHDKHFDPGVAFGALQRYRKLTQGDAVLSFYRSA